MADPVPKKEEENQSSSSTTENSPMSTKSGMETSFSSLTSMIESKSSENRLQEYENKIQKLSNYVLKFKKALEQKNEVVQKQTTEIENLKQTNQDLEAFVNKVMNEDQTSKIDVSKIKKVNCNIIINSVNWVCIKFEDKVEWHREEQLKNALDEFNTSNMPPKSLDIPKEYDYIKEVEKKKDDEKQIVDLQAQITQYVSQYENRILKMQEQWDEAEQRLKEAQDLKKVAESESDNISSEFNKVIAEIVDQSYDIRENTMLYSNEDVDQGMRTEALNKMKMSLMNLQKMSFDNETFQLDDLKNHLILLHQTIYDIQKKSTQLNQEIVVLEKRWKKRCEQIYHERENEKKEKNEIIEVGRKKIKDLEENLDNLKTECSKQIKERDFKIDFMNKELKKNANIEYIRNIVINFLTNPDVSVREKLLPVVGTVLQFSSTELDTVKGIWEKEHQTFSQKSAGVKGWLNNTIFGGQKQATK